MIEYALTKHAETMLKERGIQLQWLERILLNPVQQHMDLTDPALNHAIGPIAENGDRLLRIIYNDTVKPLRIVTAYFDRTLRKSP
jgi:Domain of unknown function (DUF4258)